MRPVTRLAFGLVAVLASAPPTQAAPRRIFMTSVTGTGDLSTWADAGGQSGLAAGDAICQARAAAAGLANAAGYRAWLSSSSQDAYCRIHGFAGQRATNCGQPSLPAAAGPWMRRDALPFGEAITDLLANGEVYYPLRRDEFGAPVSGVAFTATDPLGAYQGDACANWTSAAPGTFGTAGSSDRTAVGWLNYGSALCASPTVRLICLEMGIGDPLPRLAGWGRLAFLTSALGAGNLGDWPQAGSATGVAAGDAICRTLAANAGLPYSEAFKAWLSDGVEDARDRFVHDGPWMRIDRVRIADGLADLTDASLRSALNLTETGVYRSNWNVWTGTSANGLAAAERCSDWTSASAATTGRGGAANGADGSWTFLFASSCDFASSHLHCLQDLPLVFGDGFESGNAAVWTSVVP